MSNRTRKILQLALKCSDSDINIEEERNNTDVEIEGNQNTSEVNLLEEPNITDVEITENQNTLEVNIEGERNNDICDDFTEDSDDSVKDRDFVLSEAAEDSDSNISETVENEFSEEDNLPLSVIIGRNTKTEIKKILDNIIEEISRKLDGHMYTKKGTLRKRKKYDTSPETRKKFRLNNKKQKHSSIKENCGEKCKRKCTAKISRHRQELINQEYWNMDHKERRAFILHKTSTTAVKRRSQIVSAEECRRNRSVSYYLPDETGSNQQVCKKFILATLGFEMKNDRVLRNITLVNERTSIIPKQDNRGRKQKENKFDKRLIEHHVESFEPTISHYRREHAPLRKYLPSDITIRAMHHNFILKHKVNISYELYRKVVAGMNISFSNLGHEECFVCETFSIHCKSTGHEKNNNTPEDCDMCTLFQKHREGYRKARAEYKLDTMKKDGLYVSADLQKVIMLPRCEMFKEIIFMPRLIAFNETFVPLGTSKEMPFAFIWHEATSGRSKDDIISTFYNFLVAVRDVERVTIWLDNCAAQNKNWGLISFLTYAINSRIINLQELNLKYFQAGHTFMSSDAFHHQVELALKRKKKVYDFEDFGECVASANSKKVIVKEMTIDKFYTFPDLTSQYKLSKLNPRPYLQDMVFIQFQRGQRSLKFKSSFSGDFQCINFLLHKYESGSLPQPTIKNNERGISKERKNNIINKIKGLVPENRLLFWQNLKETEREIDLD